MTRPSAVWYGGVLGFCNTMLISRLLGPYWHDSFAIGFYSITGMTVALGEATSRYPVWARTALLEVPALAVLLGMACMFGEVTNFLPALVPTFVFALLLERRTRYRSNVPAARVH
jgi:hypothetical protein